MENSSISSYFENLTDPQRDNKRHELIDIITIAIWAVIWNADNYEQICLLGNAKYDWFKNFLGLHQGINTFRQGIPPSLRATFAPEYT